MAYISAIPSTVHGILAEKFLKPLHNPKLTIFDVDNVHTHACSECLVCMLPQCHQRRGTQSPVLIAM